MTNFKFEDQTEEIYKLVLSLSPGPFRKKATEALNEALIKRIGEDGEVTEATLVESIKESTPKPFLPLGMKKIKHLLKDEY